MITVNAILTLNGKEIVPVRAIPFVTGGDMNPKCLAGILSDPDQWLLAFLLGPNSAITKMLPKNWKQYRDQLAVIACGANNLDFANRTTLEILPSSTFVYWEGLWRTHENCFLPSREEIFESPPEEQVNYELQPIAIIPKDLVELVFEGFQVPWTPYGAHVVPPITSIPSVTAPCPIAAIGTGSLAPIARGASSWSIRKPMRRDPLADALFATLTAMCVCGQARPKARDILDEYKRSKPAEIVEVAYDELKYETSIGNNKVVSIDAIQKRLDKLIT